MVRVKLRIGILAQSTYTEHHILLEVLNCETIEVKKVDDFEKIQGLIISGNSSSVITKLRQLGLVNKIKEFAARDFPIFGICGGMVILSKNIVDRDQSRLGLMDINVEEDLLEQNLNIATDLLIPAIGSKTFPAVFKNSPYIQEIKPNVGILAEYNGKIVFVRQGNMLASSFHPELGSDCRVHQYFRNMVKENII